MLIYYSYVIVFASTETFLLLYYVYSVYYICIVMHIVHIGCGPGYISELVSANLRRQLF